LMRILDTLAEEPFYARYQSRVRELLHPAAGRHYVEVVPGTWSQCSASDQRTAGRRRHPRQRRIHD
jgi:hypothetical protein